jgi:hypothetical protein
MDAAVLPAGPGREQSPLANAASIRWRRFRSTELHSCAVDCESGARVGKIPNMTEADIAPWVGNWAWGLPLILLTVVIHVFGLALVNDRVVRVLRRTTRRRSFIPLFAIIMAVAVLLATALHGIEAVAWAGAYRFLGAVPDGKSAMLYSLNAMTTYGHESVSLAPHWQMMGALEALNGMLLFGLTTAFLFAMIQEVWQSHRRH